MIRDVTIVLFSDHILKDSNPGKTDTSGPIALALGKFCDEKKKQNTVSNRRNPPRVISVGVVAVVGSLVPVVRGGKVVLIEGRLVEKGLRLNSKVEPKTLP